nr:MAG TPA: hypothetical protein [Caudoviricetes sp.]DAT51881.1 MAG TPA: hypothetical protein [Caudoviricetes sp.]
MVSCKMGITKAPHSKRSSPFRIAANPLKRQLLHYLLVPPDTVEPSMIK